MKNYFIIIFLFLSNIVYSQFIDTNNYIAFTKEEIIETLRENDYRYWSTNKFNVKVDSTGNWTHTKNYYTYIIDYELVEDSIIYNGKFTFDKKSGFCTNYHISILGLSSYYDYIDYFNNRYDKDTTRYTTWIDKRNRYYILIYLYPYLGQNRIGIYYEFKWYSDEFYKK